MYSDSQALYSDDDSIFPPNSNAKEASFTKGRELFMDCGTNTNYSTEYNKHYGTSNQNSTGLLRFRSAPSSLLENFTDGVGKSVKNGGENQGLTSRFSSSGTHSNQVSHSGNGYALNSQLPPHHPSSGASTTQMESVNGGYRIPNSIGMDHQGQLKIGSNLTRQNSSPAELFSHLSAQSGTVYILNICSYFYKIEVLV